MDECDLQAEQPPARLLVDQLRALGGETRELRCDVVDLERDVMHPRPALGDELADGRVRAERREQLDSVVADAQRGSFDALMLDARPVLECRAEEALVGRDRRVEVGDRDTEMMNSLRRHERDVTFRPDGGAGVRDTGGSCGR